MELGKLPISLDSSLSHPYKTVRVHKKLHNSHVRTLIKKKKTVSTKIIYKMK